MKASARLALRQELIRTPTARLKLLEVTKLDSERLDRAEAVRLVDASRDLFDRAQRDAASVCDVLPLCGFRLLKPTNNEVVHGFLHGAR